MRCNHLRENVESTLKIRPHSLECSKLIHDLSQICEVDILIVSQHLRGGVADQFQLVFVGTRYRLEQRGEGVTAAMGRVLVVFSPVDRVGWVVASYGIQRRIEGFPVRLEGERRPIGGAEHLPGVFPVVRRSMIGWILWDTGTTLSRPASVFEPPVKAFPTGS